MSVHGTLQFLEEEASYFEAQPAPNIYQWHYRYGVVCTLCRFIARQPQTKGLTAVAARFRALRDALEHPVTKSTVAEVGQ